MVAFSTKIVTKGKEAFFSTRFLQYFCVFYFIKDLSPKNLRYRYPYHSDFCIEIISYFHRDVRREIASYIKESEGDSRSQ